jgi:hypothetical protein
MPILGTKSCGLELDFEEDCSSAGQTKTAENGEDMEKVGSWQVMSCFCTTSREMTRY